MAHYDRDTVEYLDKNNKRVGQYGEKFILRKISDDYYKFLFKNPNGMVIAQEWAGGTKE